MESTKTKIKFIEIITKEYIENNVSVNDLTVKDDHSYTVLDNNNNNLVVHNCTTAMVTSFGNRGTMASDLEEVSHGLTVPIIADGGIVNPGDIAVAIRMGASMIMAGSLFSGISDGPSKIITDRYGNKFTTYYGSASEHNNGKTNRIEGTLKKVEAKNKTMIEQQEYIIECLQSAISYAGGKTLEDLKNVEYQISNHSK